MRVMREDSNSFTSYTVDAEGIQTAVAELMTQDTRGWRTVRLNDE